MPFHIIKSMGNIKLGITSKGLEYLELNEGETKTRNGENVNDLRKVSSRVYLIPGDDEDLFRSIKDMLECVQQQFFLMIPNLSLHLYHR
jgi:hypothetical protein